MVNPNKIHLDFNEKDFIYTNRKKKKNFNFMEVLKNKHPEIHEELIRKYPNIKLNNKYDYYTFYKKDEKIIGFGLFSTNLNKQFYSKLILEFFYIIDEYYEEIKILNDILYGNMPDIAIRNPSRSIIEKMLDDNLAELVNNRFVETHTDLIFDAIRPDDALYKTINFNEDLDTWDKPNKYVYYTSFYDLELCSGIDRGIVSPKDSEDKLGVEYSPLTVCYQEDNEKYNCLDKRIKDKWVIDNEYDKNMIDIVNIWTVLSPFDNGYDIYVEEDEKEKTEEYYHNKDYLESENYKKYFSKKID